MWYLSFDCATKTLAFSLCRIDVESYRKNKIDVLKRINATKELLRRASDYNFAVKHIDRILASSKALDKETLQYIQIVDGETVDLFPDIADKDIKIVDRIRALSNYVHSRIIPILLNKDVTILIEYQMGANTRARNIEAALISIFVSYNVVVVGPSLKNKISLCEEGKYHLFAAKYSNSYTANKAHTKFNFDYAESIFGTSILPSKPSKRGHIADSFMQTIGYIAYML